MATSNWRDVGEFHEKFGLPHVKGDPGPREFDDEAFRFRYKFLREELDEFSDGYFDGDHAKMADSLVDLVYVALGTAHMLGYPWQEIWNEVQRANMAKVRAQPDGSDSLRGSSLDVVKPEGWQPPDVEAIMARWGFPTPDEVQDQRLTNVPVSDIVEG